MSPRPITHLGKIVALTFLASGALEISLPLHADEHSMIEAIHDKLHQAMNPGGDAPSDAERTSLLQAALEELKDLPFGHWGHWGHRNAAISDVKMALDALKSGNENREVYNDIRDADAEVRTME
jgi:hypothetical protein